MWLVTLAAPHADTVSQTGSGSVSGAPTAYSYTAGNTNGSSDSAEADSYVYLDPFLNDDEAIREALCDGTLVAEGRVAVATSIYASGSPGECLVTDTDSVLRHGVVGWNPHAETAEEAIEDALGGGRTFRIIDRSIDPNPSSAISYSLAGWDCPPPSAPILVVVTWEGSSAVECEEDTWSHNESAAANLYLYHYEWSY